MPENLNPEAVEAAAKATFDVRDDEFDLDEWEDLDATERERYECDARAAVSAYFAALPSPRPGTLINTVEELDRLPSETVILDKYKFPFRRGGSLGVGHCGNWESVEYGEVLDEKYIAFPASVLWVPTEGGEE